MKRTNFILELIIILSLIIGCMVGTQICADNISAGTKYSEANLANGGRFCFEENKIYGPFGNNGELSAYDLSNNQITPISNDTDFSNLIVHEETILFLCNGQLMKICHGERSLLSEGPIPCFRVQGDKIYYLTEDEKGQKIIVELNVDETKQRTIFTYFGTIPSSGAFTLGDNAIYFFVGEIGILKIDIDSGEVKDLSNYIEQIEQIGIIRMGSYQDGNLYFLGEVFYDLFRRPSFLYKLDLTSGELVQLTDNNTTKYTLDLDSIYFSSGGGIFKMDKETSSAVLLEENISPTAMEIVHNYLIVNEGGMFSCDFRCIETKEDKGADKGSALLT